MTVATYSNESKLFNQHLFDLILSIMAGAVPMPLALQLKDLQVELNEKHLTPAGRLLMAEFDDLISDEQTAVAYAAFMAGIRYSRAFEQTLAGFPFPASLETDFSD